MLYIYMCVCVLDFCMHVSQNNKRKLTNANANNKKHHDNSPFFYQLPIDIQQ